MPIFDFTGRMPSDRRAETHRTDEAIRLRLAEEKAKLEAERELLREKYKNSALDKVSMLPIERQIADEALKRDIALQEATAKARAQGQITASEGTLNRDKAFLDASTNADVRRSREVARDALISSSLQKDEENERLVSDLKRTMGPDTPNMRPEDDPALVNRMRDITAREEAARIRTADPQARATSAINTLNFERGRAPMAKTIGETAGEADTAFNVERLGKSMVAGARSAAESQNAYNDRVAQLEAERINVENAAKAGRLQSSALDNPATARAQTLAAELAAIKAENALKAAPLAAEAEAAEYLNRIFEEKAIKRDPTLSPRLRPPITLSPGEQIYRPNAPSSAVDPRRFTPAPTPGALPVKIDWSQLNR